MKRIGLVLGLIVVILLTFSTCAAINIRNTEVAMYENVEARQENIANVHSNMWAIIKGQAEVSDEYRQGFDSIYTKMIAGRYAQGDGTLMKWITESNPNFDTSLYSQLSTSIEVQRTILREEQKGLLDEVRNYNTFIKRFPASIVLNKEPLKANIITSTRSQEAVATGVDDDLSIF